jgi:hypothetical protein
MTIYTGPELFTDLTPTPAERISEGLGQGVTSGLALLISNRIQDMRRRSEKNRLVQRGFPPQIAEVWGELSEGGRTKFADLFMDEVQRGLTGQDTIEIGEEKIESPSVREAGLTPKETVARQEKRYDKNLPLYQDLEKKRRAHETENLKIDQLQRLNQSGALPAGLGRINVNFKTGELLLPAAATPEAQLFIKTVNDFLVGAKDTFGSRVTNFEIQRFLKRLPTLANSKEGRDAILRQMEVINELNQLNEEGILNAFENAGGLRNLDYDAAVRQGRKDTRDREKQLKEEFAQIAKLRPKADTEIEENEIIMIDPQGRRRAVKKEDVKKARDAGYTLQR